MRGLTVWLPKDVAEAVRWEAESRSVSVSAELRRRVLLTYPGVVTGSSTETRFRLTEEVK